MKRDNKTIIELSPSRQIVETHLAEIRTALVQAESVLDIKRIVDTTAILAEAAKRAHLSLDTVNEVQGIRLDAEIKLGHVLIGAKGAGKLRKAEQGRPLKSVVGHDTYCLSDYNISRDLSSRAQAFADNEEEVRETVQGLLEAGDEISILSLFDNLRGEAKRRKKKAIASKLRSQPVPDPTETFDVIVIDPPWSYDNRSEDQTHRARNPYPDMTLEEITDLPLLDRANENCILWLWTTNAFISNAFDIVGCWGFEVKTILTWGKNKIGLGDWLRGQTEHCLMCVRGVPLVELTNQSTLLLAPAREHSRKPEEFYALVESLCPGTKLEMFAREQRPGWQAWGAETSKFNGDGTDA